MRPSLLAAARDLVDSLDDYSGDEYAVVARFLSAFEHATRRATCAVIAEELRAAATTVGSDAAADELRSVATAVDTLHSFFAVDTLPEGLLVLHEPPRAAERQHAVVLAGPAGRVTLAKLTDATEAAAYLEAVRDVLQPGFEEPEPRLLAALGE